MMTTTGPRIYVADLAAYNAGHLHGVWIDATQDHDDITAEIDAMLATSPVGPDAEEYAIHDYEGFGPFRVGEYATIETVQAVAEAFTLCDEPMALAAWLDNDSSNLGTPADMVDAFHAAYRGQWRDVTDYAHEIVDSLGMLRDADDAVARYFDFAAFGRDLVLGGDIWTAPAPLGDVFVFDANA